MQRLRLTALLAAAATLLPASARADDWQDPQYTDEWTDERPSESYDVSVDDVGPTASVTFDTFYSSLGPYGQWVDVPAYGRVWRPQVASGWRPYYYGRWEWTNEGWLWVSDEPFGWAAYHYGRWTYDTFHGWVWIPGYQWAPAWVHWRYSGDVIGWAPLAPGLSIYVSTYPFYDTWWTFVPTVWFVSGPVYHHAYAPHYTRQYFYRTAPAPARPAPRGGVRSAAAPAPAWGGPAPRSIEQRVGRAIRPARIVAAPTPGAARARPGEVTVYRPEVRSSSRAGERGRGAGFAPAPGREVRESFVPSPRGAVRREAGVAAAPRGGERGGRREEGFGPPRSERSESRTAPPPVPRSERSESRAAPQPVPRSERSESRSSAPQAAPRSESRSTSGGFRPAPPSSGGSRGAPAHSSGGRAAPAARGDGRR
jgi:hypothetical protein